MKEHQAIRAELRWQARQNAGCQPKREASPTKAGTFASAVQIAPTRLCYCCRGGCVDIGAHISASAPPTVGLSQCRSTARRRRRYHDASKLISSDCASAMAWNRRKRGGGSGVDGCRRRRTRRGATTPMGCCGSKVDTNAAAVRSGALQSQLMRELARKGCGQRL
eukprot:364794-Chlamydomonas_euryale.AAC.23